MLYSFTTHLNTKPPPLPSSPHLPRPQPPCSERQRLQLHRRRSDIPPKRHYAYDHTHHIRHIITVSGDIADSAAVDASVLFGFGDAGEGGGDKRRFEVCERGERRGAGGDGEEVDEFEDEEAGEGAAEVGDAGVVLVWFGQQRGL